MKRFLIFLFISSILTSKGYSQNSSIFGDKTTSFNIAIEIPDGIDNRNISIKTNSDTIINGLTYKIVTEYSTIGFIREDTSNGKLWFLSEEDSLEQLIMDLTLSIGDTFHFNTSIYNMDNEYVVVDTVIYFNNNKNIIFNKSLNMWGEEEKLKFIEGVGPNAGILYLWNQNFHGYIYNNYLLCAFKDSVKTHSNNLYMDECYLYRVDIKGKINHDLISINPNPATDYINITMDNSLTKTSILQVINSQGEVLKNINSFDSKNLKIDIRGLSKGTYYIKIYNEGRLKITRKLLITE